jgi:hypothetical protein
MRFTRIVAVFVLSAAATAAAQNGPTQGKPEDPTAQARAAATEYRSRVAAGMKEAAAHVGITIDEGKLMLATRDDALVAIAPASGEKDVFLFMQASFAESTCAEVFAAGYYRVKTVPAAKGRPTKAQFINGEGKVVATGSLTSEERKAQPEEKDKLQVGIQLRHTGGATARTTLGVCRCQWIPWFRWRRLHVVVT